MEPRRLPGHQILCRQMLLLTWIVAEYLSQGPSPTASSDAAGGIPCLSLDR